MHIINYVSNSVDLYTLEWSFPRFRNENYNHLSCVNCLISLKEEAFIFHSPVTYEKNDIKVRFMYLYIKK